MPLCARPGGASLSLMAAREHSSFDDTDREAIKLGREDTDDQTRQAMRNERDQPKETISN